MFDMHISNDVKPFLVCGLDPELYPKKVSNNIYKNIVTDIKASILLSYGASFIPVNSIFETRYSDLFLDELLVLIESEEIKLVGEITDICDFAEIKKAEYSGVFSGYHDEKLLEEIVNINPKIHSPFGPITDFLERQLLNDGIDKIGVNVRKSTGLNVSESKLERDLSSLLLNRSLKPITSHTFCDISEHISYGMPEYIYKRTVTEINNIYYLKYCLDNECTIPSNMPSLNQALIDPGDVSGMCPLPYGNMGLWRRIFRLLQVDIQSITFEGISQLRLSEIFKQSIYRVMSLMNQSSSELERSFWLSKYEEISSKHIRNMQSVQNIIENFHRISELGKGRLDVMGNADRTKVFISYSHKDKDWLQRVLVHLKPLERKGLIEAWNDTKILPGNKWKDDIESALELSQVAVLLVSADFMASDFITNNELPPLLTAAKEKGATIIPLIIKPSYFSRDSNLSCFQAMNDPSKPLVNLSEGDSEAILVHLAHTIEDILEG